MRGKLSFPYVDIWFGVPILKNSSLKCWCVSAFFCGGHKNTYGHNFEASLILDHLGLLL